MNILFVQDSGESGGGSSPSKGSCGTGRLDAIHPRLYQIIGIPTSYNLSDMPKPQWITDFESGKPFTAPGPSLRSPKSRIGVQSRKIGAGGYYTEDELSDGDVNGLSRSHVPHSRPHSQTAYRGGISSSSGSRLTSQAEETSESDSDSYACPVSAKAVEEQMTSSESDSDSASEYGNVRDMEKVSVATPHSANRSVSGWTNLQDRLAVPAYRDFQLFKIGIGFIAESTVATKTISGDIYSLPAISVKDIPARGLRYPHIEEEINQYADNTVLHVTLGIDLTEINNLSAHDLRVELRINARRVEGIPTTKGVNLVTTCGYHLSDGDDTLEPDVSPLAEVSPIDENGLVTLGPAPFVDRYLSTLANDSAKAESAVLPYYWITQRISTPRSTLILIYTLKAAANFSINVERLVL